MAIRGGLVLVLVVVAATAGESPIPRRLPPPGGAPAADVAERLGREVARIEARLAEVGDESRRADVAVFAEAVAQAIALGEFWDGAKDVTAAEWAIAEADQRMTAAATAPWRARRGLVPLGYVSAIDGSVQPYGVDIPEQLDLAKPVPLYVWLHGRDEKLGLLRFLQQRTRDRGPIHPDDGITLHAYGRGCVGFKSAGEIDVLDAIADAQRRWRIDPDRIALLGFSMGGAGAKHLGAHYADRFACIHAGAGFAETEQYLGIKPGERPPWEEALWGAYDTPDYVRNLLAVPFTCYSGENDKQIQAAQVMEAAFRAEGATLTHVIGPKTGHAYEPKALEHVLTLLHQAIADGRPHAPAEVHLQTRSLRWHAQWWVDATGLVEQWRDSRIDARGDGDAVEATTTNIASARFTWPGLRTGGRIRIDGDDLAVAAAQDGIAVVRDAGRWHVATAADDRVVRKRPGLQGPIDDAFLAPFLVVLPSRPGRRPQVDAWVAAESQHQCERWSALMHGAPRTKRDVDVTADDIAAFNLVLWGDPESNTLIARIADRLLARWDGETLRLADQAVPAASHVPVLIQPDPLAPDRYIVLNSGLTFREACDRTNALQNPTLPDWAVIALDRAPDDQSPGRIVAAGFCDESWQPRSAR